MPSTYTVNLGIQKPATGEQSGTWGNTTNANFDILDQGINGAIRLTLTSAGSSGSPNALAINEGSVSDGHNKWIEFYSSSDLGGNVFVQLTPNDAEKIVFVRNSLAGSRSVLLFQGTYNSGRDLEIPAGVDMVVKFSGGGANAATVTDVYTKLRATEITTPSLTATTADINGGTIDNSVIGGSTAAAVTGTAIVANTSLNIAGDGATVTGIKDEDNMASNSATKLATQQSIKAYVDSQVGTVDTLSEILANGNTTGGTDIAVSANDDITFTDSSKAIFGAGSDLEIYHDASNSYIKEAGTGNLFIDATSLRLRTGAGTETYLTADGNGAVALYHNNIERLDTNAVGVSVTGILDIFDNNSDISPDNSGSGQFRIDGNGYKAAIALNASGVNLYSTSATRPLIFGVNETEVARVTTTGLDVTGSIIGDALTIDTTASNGVTINAHDNVTTTYPLKVSNAAGSGNLELGAYGINNDIDLRLQKGGSTKLRVHSTGVEVTGTVEFDGLSGTGSVTITDILDEDNMASNSATKLATQQSIKSYVDTQVATIPSGDITSVVAGTGLTGGGTSGAVTLNVTTLNQNTTGNAATATALQTARTIAGVSFNGTANISLNNNAITNGAGYTTNTGDITGVTAGTGLTGGGTSGAVTLNLGTAGAGAGTYGSTSNTTKIDNITLDAYGRVTAVTTGATGDITGVTAGTQLTGGGTSGTVTLNVSQGAGSGLDADTLDGIQGASYLRSDASDTFTGTLTMAGTLQMNGNPIDNVSNIYLKDKIFHHGNTGAYLDFHATDQWRVVTGGTERLEVNNSAVTVAGVLSVGGAIDLIDNKILRFGSSDDVEFFFNGSHMYTDLNLGDWYIRDGTTSRFLFNDNGDFHADANIFAYSTSVGSDRKLKDNIELIESPLEKIQKLNGVTFNWKRDGEASAGVIAQDVQKVLPSAVKEVKQLSDEGEDATRLNVDYNQIIGLLVESVKELKKEIEELKKGK